ncbi:MAG: Hsp20/alpha crystallin family protein [Ruminiclostridium sp.]
MLPAIFNENLFDDFFDDRFMMPSVFGKNDPLYGKNAKNVMKTDVRETENSYELDIDLPGFKKEDVSLKLDDGYLTIGAVKSLEKESQNGKDGKYIRRERYEGQCSRSFFVGRGVQARDVSAKFEDGILKVSVPKTAQPEVNNYIAIE